MKTHTQEGEAVRSQDATRDANARGHSKQSSNDPVPKFVQQLTPNDGPDEYYHGKHERGRPWIVFYRDETQPPARWVWVVCVMITLASVMILARAW